MLQCRCSVAQAIQRNWQAYLCSLNKQQFFGIVRKGHYSSIFKELSTRMVLGSWLFTCNKLNVKISCSCNFLGIPKQKNNHVRLNWANIKSYLSNRPHVLWRRYHRIIFLNVGKNLPETLTSFIIVDSFVYNLQRPILYHILIRDLFLEQFLSLRNLILT